MTHKTSSTLVTLHHYSQNVRTLPDSIQICVTWRIGGPGICMRGGLKMFVRSNPVSRGLQRAVWIPYSCRNLPRKQLSMVGALGSHPGDDLWASATATEGLEPTPNWHPSRLLRDTNELPELFSISSQPQGNIDQHTSSGDCNCPPSTQT